jgi:glycosyltransferase involved in cell wall biosynthesis
VTGSTTGPVLQVVTDTDRRGAQVFATDLHAALERQDVKVRTVALAPGRVGGLDLPVLGQKRWSGATVGGLRAVAKDASVVIGHGSTTLPVGALTTLGTGTPFVYRQISDSRFWAPSGLRRLRVRLAMQRCRALVALWEGAATTVHEHFGVPGQRIHVIPNGVPATQHVPADPGARPGARRSFGLDADRPTLLAIGALAPEKGVDLVVDALAALPDAQLLVVGDGPARAGLTARAERVAAGRVVFTGSVPDPGPAYTAADVVVLASRGGDSMPAVLIEAGLRALPVVSTRVEAIPEVVVDGVTGRVVGVDAPAELQEAIASVLAAPTTAAAYGAAARAHCLERYDIDVVAAQWRRVLEHL